MDIIADLTNEQSAYGAKAATASFYKLNTDTNNYKAQSIQANNAIDKIANDSDNFLYRFSDM